MNKLADSRFLGFQPVSNFPVSKILRKFSKMEVIEKKYARLMILSVLSKRRFRMFGIQGSMDIDSQEVQSGLLGMNMQTGSNQAYQYQIIMR